MTLESSTMSTPAAHPSLDEWVREAGVLVERYAQVELPALMGRAYSIARTIHGDTVTYSPKVFIPLTRLCRDICHYCTFSRTPGAVERPFLLADEIREIARAGVEAGCGEALFTLGDSPELRYRAARDGLGDLGFATTSAYCAAMADMVQREFGLVAHINAGVLSAEELSAYRKVSGSQGLMLETVSERLCERGQVHFGSNTKIPAARLATIEEAGRQRIPFTTGILVGIGETRLERVASLLAIRDLHLRHGHIQEFIVQNFVPKADTLAADRQAPDFEELLWSIAVARLVLPAEIHLQAPPNLSFDRFAELLDAGIDDWGGISPVTPDHVNPEAPWPQVDRLRTMTASRGLKLAARSPVYPRWGHQPEKWIAPEVRPVIRRASAACGLLRDSSWSPGNATPVPQISAAILPASSGVEKIIATCLRGDEPSVHGIARMLAARDGDYHAILTAADGARAKHAGNTVTYVVNRNINYTNICAYRCGFCAFSKGKTHNHLRGRPYDLSLDEIARRAIEAAERGATEVCMQGGIHPRFTGNDYLAILRTVKDAVPKMHVHAFSPLEVQHGASTLGIDERDFLLMLQDAGLGSLPGTAAEVLKDRVRAVICPDKLDTQSWLRIVGTAHEVGLKTTSTLMFGHVEAHEDVAEHLLALRRLQDRTGGITEFVPLPFVHAEAPMSLKGLTRKGPTFSETMLVHAVARLVLGPLIPNIQASWVKLGRDGAARALSAGVNDLGGVLMNESISRAAGASYGQELGPAEIEAIAAGLGRPSRQRTTLYGTPDPRQQARSYSAGALLPIDGPQAGSPRIAEGIS